MIFLCQLLHGWRTSRTSELEMGVERLSHVIRVDAKYKFQSKVEAIIRLETIHE